MLVVLGIIARVAIVLGISILAKTVLTTPNKLYRFVFLFFLFVPMNFLINYVNIQLLGYHKAGWTFISILALLMAGVGAFWQPQTDNSNTP